MNDSGDTIAAIGTPPGEGGISVVRVSGCRAFEIADRVFRCSYPPPSRRPQQSFVYGHVCDSDGDIDEALLLIMRRPRSYTCEDMIEIQGHGGAACARRILRSVTAAGARPAEPGEFTRRAFINGRIDLVQAEAVLDLIRARSERARRAALEQLEGKLSDDLEAIYNDLTTVAANLEALLDFPEEDLPADMLPAGADELQRLRKDIAGLLTGWEEGRILREGLAVVISGPPNAGKSTLLNRLLGFRRAIVTPYPGTTRDVIEDCITLDGIPLRLIDTAGIRDSACPVESEGVSRAHAQISRADLVLYVIDASQPAAGTVGSGLQSKNTIIIMNKCDLGRAAESNLDPAFEIVETSLLTGYGLESLKDLLLRKVYNCQRLSESPHAVINERHYRLLQSTKDAMEEARELLALHGEGGLVLVSQALRSALENLGAVIGRRYDEDMLDRIFSRFCIGK